MMKIKESVKADIEAATGQAIPDPQSAGFEKYYEKLLLEHPELAKKLEDALEVTEPFPEEEAKRDAQRRESLAATVQRVFFKEAWGHQALNRRALRFVLFFVMFGVIVSSWAIMLLRKPSESLAQMQPLQEEQSNNAPESPPVSQSATTETPPSETIREENLLLVPDTPAQTSTQTNAPPRTLDVPPAPAPAKESLPLYTGQVPSAPTEDSYEAGNTLAFEVPAATELSQASVLAFETEKNLEPVTAFEEQSTQQASVFAFENETPSQAASVFAESFVTPEAALETTSLSPTDEPTTSGKGSSVLAFEPSEDDTSLESPQIEDVPPSELSIPETAQQPETELLLDTASLEPASVPADLLKAGTLIPATLTKDVVLTAGEMRQVIADSDETWCGEDCPPLRWLGEATLLESGRLEVVFKQVVIENKVIEINGTAFGEDNAQGLPAHIADTTPTLLADVLRSGAGGVTDYVQAQTNRRTVTEQGDTTVTEQNVPGLLDFILGRAAGTLRIPEGETNVIRLAAVEKGMRLEVLYLGE